MLDYNYMWLVDNKFIHYFSLWNESVKINHNINAINMEFNSKIKYKEPTATLFCCFGFF